MYVLQVTWMHLKVSFIHFIDTQFRPFLEPANHHFLVQNYLVQRRRQPYRRLRFIVFERLVHITVVEERSFLGGVFRGFFLLFYEGVASQFSNWWAVVGIQLDTFFDEIAFFMVTGDPFAFHKVELGGVFLLCCRQKIQDHANTPYVFFFPSLGWDSVWGYGLIHHAFGAANFEFFQLRVPVLADFGCHEKHVDALTAMLWKDVRSTRNHTIRL